jgi:hypothetical protein
MSAGTNSGRSDQSIGDSGDVSGEAVTFRSHSQSHHHSPAQASAQAPPPLLMQHEQQQRRRRDEIDSRLLQQQGFHPQLHGELTKLNVVLTGADAVAVTSPKTLTTDESYTLMVAADGVATLTAASVWGMVYGLVTFSQLLATPSIAPANSTATVQANFGGGQGETANGATFHPVPAQAAAADGAATGAGGAAGGKARFELKGVPIAITDGPRFPWRGLMVDTANHFIPVATLLSTVRDLPILLRGFVGNTPTGWGVNEGACCVVFPFESM